MALKMSIFIAFIAYLMPIRVKLIPLLTFKNTIQFFLQSMYLVKLILQNCLKLMPRSIPASSYCFKIGEIL